MKVEEGGAEEQRRRPERSEGDQTGEGGRPVGDWDKGLHQYHKGAENYLGSEDHNTAA